MNRALRLAVGFLSAALAAFVAAQEFPALQGGPGRFGHQDINLQTNNPGRAFLRWWDPLISATFARDNPDPNTQATPPADWLAPTDIQAFNFVQNDFTQPAYLYAFTVPSRSAEEPNIPATGQQLRRFTWNYPGTVLGQEFALYVNLPIGPTDVDTSNNVNLAFPQRFYVYEIAGVQNPDNPGQPIVEIIDNFAVGGGLTRLGGDKLYTADNSGTIAISLLNTVPRDSQNNLTDTPGTTLVYADYTEIARAISQLGNYQASPIVGQLKSNPDQFPWRVVAARNEQTTVQVGNESRTYTTGIVTSYAHDGNNIDPTDDGTGRRNMVWSWPSKRPFLDSSAELTRYVLGKRDFVLGQTPTGVPPSRADVKIVKDNASAGVTTNGLWISTPALPGENLGTDYLTAPAGSANTTVDFAPKLQDGNYTVYVWLPTNKGGLATSVKYEIYEGGQPGVSQPTAVVTINQSNSASGWVRLTSDPPFPRSKFSHSALNTLKVRINAQNSSGGTVYADAVRFVKQANLGAMSTPVAASVNINVPGQGLQPKDVVVVALENGRLYCVDATGNGDGTTRVYWVYPSEVSGADPNQVATEDGPDGIAENPIGFDLSSALVKRVDVGGGNLQDILYIGSRNGRVYAIDMAGRGDGTATQYGTTTRRWSYPNDYPATPIDSTLGPIVGSVSYADTANGPTIFVPATQGRLYALDAVGSAANKTTSVRWAYPDLISPTIGAIDMASLARFDSVFFGSENGTFYSLNWDTGAVRWTFNGSPGNPTLPFTTSSPASASAADMNGNTPLDTVFLANTNNRVYALNAATGAIQWETNEVPSTAVGGLTFTYLSVFNVGGSRAQHPVVIVPRLDGAYVALFARPEDLNSDPSGTKRRAWQFNTQSSVVTTSMATGGDNTPQGFNWMHGVDGDGFLYSFNDEPGFITIGTPPGVPGIVENDPSFAGLTAIAAGAKVRFFAPSDWESISKKLRDGTLNYSDITNAQNTPITRRNFESGETLYLIIYDIPDPKDLADPLNRITITMQFNSSGQAAQRRSVPIQRIPNGAPGGKEGIAMIGFPILGIGSNALAPGGASLESTVTISGQQGGSARITMDTFRIANPLAVQVRYDPGLLETIGNTINAADPEVLNNGNLVGPGNGTYKTIRDSLGPDVNNPGDAVSHGQTSTTQVLVLDRSLMRLLLGDQHGLSNVRFNTTDLAWQGAADAVYKPLDPVAYPNFEEMPILFPNVSADYPDLSRDTIKVIKELFGAVENPLFAPVSLVPPNVTQGALQTYRTATGYNNQLQRTLLPTTFDLTADVPKFQPPNRNGNGPRRGYDGLQLVYVDANPPGRQFVGGRPAEAYREFDLLANVAIDEKLTVTTPTIDLGSLPEGAGFTPVAPFDPASVFSPWNPSFNSFFQRYTVENQGNLNMLNVRVAKFTDTLQGVSRVYVPVPLVSPALHELAWLDAPLHLHSDVDPRFAPGPANRVVMQKARPGDLSPTQLSVNAKRRGNANLGVTEGYLLDTALFPPGDPKVGATAPIGAPAGQYVQRIFVFEDRTSDLSLGPDDPAKDGLPGSVVPNVYEPYADPSFILKFSVRESRLTNSFTNKTSPMIDNLLAGNEAFTWSNLQPAAIRDGDGNVIVAFASNRLLDSNAPGWLARPKNENDPANGDSWRLYVGTLNGNVPPQPADGFGQSSLRDLNVFQPDTNQRWFRQQAGPYPTFPDALIFGQAAGETIEPGSVNYGSPAFPASGPFDPLAPITQDGRVASTFTYMAFLGEAVKRSARGERTIDQRLIITRVGLPGNARVAMGRPFIMRFDPQGKKSRPALVATGPNATVFYTVNSGGTGQLAYNFFRVGNNDPGAVQGFSPTQTINLSSSFESVGAPTVTLRRYRAGASGENRIDVLFTAKLRGKSQVEAFMGHVRANSQGRPVRGLLSYGVRTDRLTLDPASGVYWAPGVEWALNGAAQSGPNRIDIFRLDSGTPVSILDLNSMLVDGNTRVVSFDTTLGGKAYIDASSGSIRFSGAVIPRGAILAVRYSPTLLRVSSDAASNYRGATMNYDERFVGETSYWANSSNQAVQPDDLIRADRFTTAFTRTSADGTQASRPYMRTLRFGVELPTPVQTRADGTLVQFQVNGNPVAPFYQVDPATGRVYFMADNEDGVVQITYRGVDENGVPYPRPILVQATVGLIEELPETAIPIEQVANESSLTLALDPLNQPFNRKDYRRPGLLWLFWTSTRTGGADLYFETLAPRYTPRAPGR